MVGAVIATGQSDRALDWATARWVGWSMAVLLLLALPTQPVRAQIYACTAPDGTRIYSDRKCGPDAKRVQGITSTRKSSNGSATKQSSVAAKSFEELDELLQLCNAGDQSACMTWARSGGPNRLRAKEQASEQACEAGSLVDCEERYCRDGISDECRRRVLQVATKSGNTWYLRAGTSAASGGPATHSIRCLREGSRQARDATITCAATTGPQRCRIAQVSRGFEQMELAATDYCATASAR